MRNFDSSEQTPVHVPNLKNLTVTKFENYCLILTALEENLAEYKMIREDLNITFEEICQVNARGMQHMGESEDKVSYSYMV